jgi:hypothetical protein
VTGERVVAVLTVGRDLQSLRAEAMFESSATVDLRKLFDGGSAMAAFT